MEHLGGCKSYREDFGSELWPWSMRGRKERGRTDGGVGQVTQRLGVHRESVRNWLRHHAVRAVTKVGGAALPRITSLCARAELGRHGLN